jgi:hypothetical protein
VKRRLAKNKVKLRDTVLFKGQTEEEEKSAAE